MLDLCHTALTQHVGPLWFIKSRNSLSLTELLKQEGSDVPSCSPHVSQPCKMSDYLPFWQPRKHHVHATNSNDTFHSSVKSDCVKTYVTIKQIDKFNQCFPSLFFLRSGDARVGGGWEGSEEPSAGWQESRHPGETCWTHRQKCTLCFWSLLVDVNADVLACVSAAFPGEGGGTGTGGGQRAAAAGGDPHGAGGGPAQRPPPPGSGELPDRAAAGPAQGTMCNSTAARWLTVKQSFYQHFLYFSSRKSYLVLPFPSLSLLFKIVSLSSRCFLFLF